MKLSNNKGLTIFLLKLFGVFISWKGIILLLGKEETPLNERLFPAISNYWEQFNDHVRYFDLKFGELSLSLLNYDVVLYEKYTIYIKGHPGVNMGKLLYWLSVELLFYYAGIDRSN